MDRLDIYHINHVIKISIIPIVGQPGITYLELHNIYTFPCQKYLIQTGSLGNSHTQNVGYAVRKMPSL